MDLKEVQKWIDGIKRLDTSGDYEDAHASEDALLLEFVSFIAGQDNEYSISQTIADEILDFIEKNDAPRYTA